MRGEPRELVTEERRSASTPVTKYVATRSTMELTWKRSVALRDAAADVARLKRADGPALITQGSSDLIQTLLANDLIDEIGTFTFPIVLAAARSSSVKAASRQRSS
jgi:dihydrofolate reductase